VPAAGDVFVATYPKCGTTWTQYIVYLLLHGGEPLPVGRKIEDVFPHLEEVGADAVAALPEPRLVKNASAAAAHALERRGALHLRAHAIPSTARSRSITTRAAS